MLIFRAWSGPDRGWKPLLRSSRSFFNTLLVARTGLAAWGWDYWNDIETASVRA